MKLYIESKLSEWVKQLDVNKKATRNAHPYASQTFRLKKDPNTNRFITGYDIPYGMTMEGILKDPAHELHGLMQERKKIEASLGLSLDSSENNEFLLNHSLCLSPKYASNNPLGGRVVLNTDIAKDVFNYRWLIANGIVAPDKESLNDFKYITSNFYFSNPLQENTSRKHLNTIKNKISAKLVQFEENRVWLLAVSELLGLAAMPGLSAETLYSQITEFKETVKEKNKLEEMFTLVNTPAADLQLKFVIHVSIKYNMITKDQDGDYCYELNKLSNTIPKSIDLLNRKENDGLFYQIRDAVFNRFGLKLKE